MSGFLVTSQPSMGELPPLQGPSQADWERHRILIKQLYVDQGLKLKEVMAVMLQHGHRASARTYKNWIMKWKLDKKHKERDMIAIRRKYQQRNQLGKKSAFRVRGQLVTMEQVEECFRRKKGSTQAIDAPTPPDVSCRTPSPIGTPRIAQSVVSTSCDPATLNINGGWNLSCNNAQHFEPHENIFQITGRDIYNILSENPAISQSPLPPEALLVSEHTLYSIRNYLDDSFQSGVWYLEKHNSFDCHLISSENSETFIRICALAVDLRDAGQFTESRRMLSKLFNLVGNIMHRQEPRSLDTFLDAFIFLIRHDQDDILHHLRKFIAAMAASIFQKNHPWSRICQNLCSIDESSLEAASVEFWRCVTDKFDEHLGSFNDDARIAKIDFITSTYLHRALANQEGIVRELLPHYETNTDSYFLLSVELFENLTLQKRHNESETVVLKLCSRAVVMDSGGNEAWAKYMLAESLYYQQKIYAAEQSLRDAIEILIEDLDQKAIGPMLTLESWLREWGRDEEALDLKVRIDNIIGKDEVDEEMELSAV